MLPLDLCVCMFVKRTHVLELELEKSCRGEKRNNKAHFTPCPHREPTDKTHSSRGLRARRRCVNNPLLELVLYSLQLAKRTRRRVHLSNYRSFFAWVGPAAPGRNAGKIIRNIFSFLIFFLICARVAPRLSQYRDPGTFSRYRSVPGRIRYQPKFPRDFEGGLPGPRVPRVPGNGYTTPPYPLNMHHDAPLSALLCTPHAAEQTQGAEGGPVFHHAWGSRRWCLRSLLVSYGNDRVVVYYCLW